MSARLYLANAGRRSVLDRPTALLSLSFNAALYVVERTESVAVTVTLARENVTDDVTLSVAGLPAGTTGSFSPTVLSGGTLVSTLTIVAIGSAALVNLHPVTVSASTALGIATSRSFALTVEDVVVAPGALFVLSTSASAINLVRDSTATVTLNLVRGGGFTATVTPALVQALPSGVTVAFVPATFAGATTSVVATFTATDVAALGAADLTVRGTGAGSEPNETPLRVQVINAGAFAHLAPTTELPMQENGTRQTFDVDTGLYDGTTVDTSWITPAYLAANANTVVTVKDSGGTFTPAQFQTVLDQSATRNDNTVVVIDDQSVMTGGVQSFTLRSKGGTYAAAGWTVYVPSSWWSAAWSPTGERFVDLRPVSGGGLEEQRFMYTIQNSALSTGDIHVMNRDNQTVFKNYFVGAFFRQNPAKVKTGTAAMVWNFGGPANSTAGVNGIEGIGMKWGVWDCGFRVDYDTGVVTRGARGAVISGSRVAIENNALIRNFFNGGENNMITQTQGKRIKVKNNFIESHSVGILIGGSNAQGVNPQHIEIRRNLLVTSQVFNEASSLFGRTAVTQWQEVAAGAGQTTTTALNNGWGTIKQKIEIKAGQDMLIEGNVIDTIFPGSGNTNGGAGIGLQFSGGTTSQEAFMDNITVANNQVVRCTQTIFISPWYNFDQTQTPNPAQAVCIKNNMGMRTRRAEVSKTHNTDLMGMTSAANRNVTGEIANSGPFVWEHNTWVTPQGETTHTWSKFLTADYPTRQNTRMTYDVTVRKNIFPNRFGTGGPDGIGIVSRLAGTPDIGDWQWHAVRRDRTGGLDRWVFEENAIPLGVPRLSRAGTEMLHPAQFAPTALWQTQSDNPWGWTAIGSSPYDYDLTLTPSSPLKGICTDGTDPGVDWAVLQAAIAGVRAYPPEDIGFGIQVEFVP